MNKFVKLQTLMVLISPEEYENYTEEMEEWTKTSNLIGSKSRGKPELPAPKYINKWFNFGLHSIDQWMLSYDQDRDHPIIIVYLTHLPTNKSFEMTLKYNDKEWMDILTQIDSTCTFFIPEK